MIDYSNTQSFVPKGSYMLARLDGRAFSAFTSSLSKPFDNGFTELMYETTVALMKQLGANLAFTQSDEISLVWYMEKDAVGDYPFGGRLQKIASLGSAIASTFFTLNMPRYLESKRDAGAALFDCRVWGEDDHNKAVMAFTDREMDCRKNAVSMVAHTIFNHGVLNGVSTYERRNMIRSAGFDFESYPKANRSGTYVGRQLVNRVLTLEELEKIPVNYRYPGLAVDKPNMSRHLGLLY